MEEVQELVEFVTIQPKIVFGLNINVIGNIHFNQKQEVIYPVESVIAFHNYLTNKQKFLRLPEFTTPRIITISPNRKMLAVVEQFSYENKTSYSIVVYDLTTYRKRRTITPTDINNSEIMTISFTSDSKALAAISYPPEERLFLFLFDKENTIMQGHTGVNNQRAIVKCIACNPTDAGLIVVAGKNIFKLMTRAERGFSSTSSNFKGDGVDIISMAWVSSDIVVAGTNKGNLLFIESGELKAKFNAFTTETLDLSIEIEPDDIIEQQKQITVDSPSKSSIENESVTCMTSFSKGFVYVIFNSIYVFEKESKLQFERKTILQITPKSMDDSFYQIMNIAINSGQDTIIVTAKHSQIYIGPLFPMESLKTQFIELKPLGENLHTDEIVGLSICSWRPIVMTACKAAEIRFFILRVYRKLIDFVFFCLLQILAKDKTVRIWNYETEKLELIKRYQVDITMIELHPTGILTAIGFSGQLKLMKIYFDDLNVIKTYNFPHCYTAKFSTLGHLIATAYENLIAIAATVNFETLKTLKGHFADVLSIAWSKNDKFLASGGVDGAVYLWDIDTGSRIQEFVNKGVQYPAVSVMQDNITIYTLTSLGTFREISQAEIVREINPDSSQPSLLSMAISRSEQILFISSDRGHIFSVQLPFMETGGGTVTNYRFFNSAVTNLKITYDDTLLITASKSGTFGIWIIKNITGKTGKMDKNLLQSTEVLIPRKSLVDKNKIIDDLEMRMKQQVNEFIHEMNEHEILAKKKIEEIQKNFQKILQEEQKKYEKLLMEKSDEVKKKQEEINELNKKHARELKNWKDKYCERVLNEYEKYKALEMSSNEKYTEYEEKLRISNENSRLEIERLENKFKNDIQKYQAQIKTLLRDKEEKKIEFIEYCRQVELDNDRLVIEIQKDYELKLKNERDLVQKWRGETKILTKKNQILMENHEKYNEEMNTVKEQNLQYQQDIENYLEKIQSLELQMNKNNLEIINKEKRINELEKKNYELELILNKRNLKISDYENNKIKPLEQKLKDDKHHFMEMELNLEKLEIRNNQLQQKLNELKFKQIGFKKDIKQKNRKIQKLEMNLADIYSDIYMLTNNINQIKILKNCIKKMYQKYIQNDFIQMYLTNQQMNSEFLRQRIHLEKLIMKIKICTKIKFSHNLICKLKQQKNFMAKEIVQLRKQLKESNKINLNNQIGEDEK